MIEKMKIFFLGIAGLLAVFCLALFGIAATLLTITIAMSGWILLGMFIHYSSLYLLSVHTIDFSINWIESAIIVTALFFFKSIFFSSKVKDN